MPELYPLPEPLHPELGIGASVGEPVAVKLEIYKFRIRFVYKDIICPCISANFQKFDVVIVIQKRDTFRFKAFSGFIESFCKFFYVTSVTVIESVHAGYYRSLRIIAFGLVCNCLRISFNSAQVRMKGTD